MAYIQKEFPLLMIERKANKNKEMSFFSVTLVKVYTVPNIPHCQGAEEMAIVGDGNNLEVEITKQRNIIEWSKGCRWISV